MRLKVKNVRAAFLNVREARAAGDDPSKKNFNGNFIVTPDHPQFKEIQAAVDQTAKDKWPKDWAVIVKQLRAANKLAFRSGDDKAKYDGFEGNWYISASNREDQPPEIRSRDGKSLLKKGGTPMDPEPYSGSFLDVTFDFWAQDNQFGKRINANIVGLQFRKHGDAFSAVAKATDEDFEDLSAEDVDDLVA